MIPANRLTEKVERSNAGVQKWMAGGRDPSAIAQAVEEKFKPLIEGGKVIEAEGVILKLPPISLYGTEMFYTQKGRQDPRDLPG